MLGNINGIKTSLGNHILFHSPVEEIVKDLLNFKMSLS